MVKLNKQHFTIIIPPEFSRTLTANLSINEESKENNPISSSGSNVQVPSYTPSAGMPKTTTTGNPAVNIPSVLESAKEEEGNVVNQSLSQHNDGPSTRTYFERMRSFRRNEELEETKEEDEQDEELFLSIPSSPKKLTQSSRPLQTPKETVEEMKQRHKGEIEALKEELNKPTQQVTSTPVDQSTNGAVKHTAGKFGELADADSTKLLKLQERQRQEILKLRKELQVIEKAELVAKNAEERLNDPTVSLPELAAAAGRLGRQAVSETHSSSEEFLLDDYVGFKSSLEMDAELEKNGIEGIQITNEQDFEAWQKWYQNRVIAKDVLQKNGFNEKGEIFGEGDASTKLEVMQKATLKRFREDIASMRNDKNGEALDKVIKLMAALNDSDLSDEDFPEKSLNELFAMLEQSVVSLEKLVTTQQIFILRDMLEQTRANVIVESYIANKEEDVMRLNNTPEALAQRSKVEALAALNEMSDVIRKGDLADAKKERLQFIVDLVTALNSQNETLDGAEDKLQKVLSYVVRELKDVVDGLEGKSYLQLLELLVSIAKDDQEILEKLEMQLDSLLQYATDGTSGKVITKDQLLLAEYSADNILKRVEDKLDGHEALEALELQREALINDVQGNQSLIEKIEQQFKEAIVLVREKFPEDFVQDPRLSVGEEPEETEGFPATPPPPQPKSTPFIPEAEQGPDLEAPDPELYIQTLYSQLASRGLIVFDAANDKYIVNQSYESIGYGKKVDSDDELVKRTFGLALQAIQRAIGPDSELYRKLEPLITEYFEFEYDKKQGSFKYVSDRLFRVELIFTEALQAINEDEVHKSELYIQLKNLAVLCSELDEKQEVRLNKIPIFEILDSNSSMDGSSKVIVFDAHDENVDDFIERMLPVLNRLGAPNEYEAVYKWYGTSKLGYYEREIPFEKEGLDAIMLIADQEWGGDLDIKRALEKALEVDLVENNGSSATEGQELPQNLQDVRQRSEASSDLHVPLMSEMGSTDQLTSTQHREEAMILLQRIGDTSELPAVTQEFIEFFKLLANIINRADAVIFSPEELISVHKYLNLLVRNEDIKNNFHIYDLNALLSVSLDRINEIIEEQRADLSERGTVLLGNLKLISEHTEQVVAGNKSEKLPELESTPIRGFNAGILKPQEHREEALAILSRLDTSSLPEYTQQLIEVFKIFAKYINAAEGVEFKLTDEEQANVTEYIASSFSGDDNELIEQMLLNSPVGQLKLLLSKISANINTGAPTTASSSVLEDLWSIVEHISQGFEMSTHKFLGFFREDEESDEKFLSRLKALSLPEINENTPNHVRVWHSVIGTAIETLGREIPEVPLRESVDQRVPETLPPASPLGDTHNGSLSMDNEFIDPTLVVPEHMGLGAPFASPTTFDTFKNYVRSIYPTDATEEYYAKEDLTTSTDMELYATDDNRKIATFRAPPPTLAATPTRPIVEADITPSKVYDETEMMIKLMREFAKQNPSPDGKPYTMTFGDYANHFEVAGLLAAYYNVVLLGDAKDRTLLNVEFEGTTRDRVLDILCRDDVRTILRTDVIAELKTHFGVTKPAIGAPSITLHHGSHPPPLLLSAHTHAAPEQPTLSLFTAKEYGDAEKKLSSITADEHQNRRGFSM